MLTLLLVYLIGYGVAMYMVKGLVGANLTEDDAVQLPFLSWVAVGYFIYTNITE